MPLFTRPHRRVAATAVTLGLAVSGLGAVAATPASADRAATFVASSDTAQRAATAPKRKKKGLSPSQASRQLRKATTPDGILAHLKAFQRIADANGGDRASGRPGYQASRDYVVAKLKKAGYKPQVKAFPFAYFEEKSPAQLRQLTPDAQTYANPADFTVMDYSGPGDVDGTVQAVDTTFTATDTSTSGCEAADFSGFTSGNIALIQRGSCDFAVKAQNAKTAGAIGVVIFNRGTTGNEGAVLGTLGGPSTLPVVGASFATGVDLGAPASTTARIVTDTISETRTTWNVFANTRGGNNKQIVMAGGHLDSVTGGEGINDNGSGTASLLEVAEQFAKLKPRFKVRFAFWGAEELGLLGAADYVENLPSSALKKIKMYLNFDMVGSRNFVRFVYDGDNSAFPPDETSGIVAGPRGSDAIERTFKAYFRGRKLVSDPTAFDGRSDYGPFIDAGIPAGGLFSGAEGIKTPAQAQRYGGQAGVAYDSCYHEPCDSINNVSRRALDQFSDAMAHSIAVYSYRIGLLKKKPGAERDRRPPSDRKRSALPAPTHPKR